MKLFFQRSDLLKSINIVSKAVSGSTTLPILKCVLIDASSDEIRLFSNDMEMAIETRADGTIQERGKVAIDARIFFEIVRKLPEGRVTVSVDENLLTTIRCEKALFQIPGRDAEDFPYPSVGSGEFSVSISQFTLKEMINQTLFSLNMSDNNKLMTGELFEIKENTLRIVALDGHRIALRKTELEGDYPNIKVVVPGKTLSEISKILSDDLQAPVMVHFLENQLLFEFDETKVFSRLIDGEYFHIDRMISNDYLTKVTVNKKDLSDCIERASLLIREREAKPIVFDIEENTMGLSIQTAIGSMQEKVDVEQTGDDIRIGFNPRFLIEPLRVIDAEIIDLYLINSKAPCCIRDENDTYLYLILPVNIP